MSQKVVMEIILGLLSLGKDLFDLLDKFKQAKKEKKEEASHLFNAIADVLKDTFEKLSNKVYPAGNCQQLLMYGRELYDKTKDIVGEQKAHELAEKIVASHKVESLFHELQNINMPEKELEKLDEASGYFRATANLIKV